MTNTKTTKRALLASVLSIVICLTMLIGSTFAWFTDSATTGVNTITAGNLDIVLEYLKDDGTTWAEADKNTKLFDDKALWEPGYTEVAYLKLTNKGSLALSYRMAIDIANEKAGTNMAGNPFNLSDYIQFGVVESNNQIATYADRAAAQAAVEGKTTKLQTYAKEADLLPGNSAYVALVVYMPTTVGNEANHMTGTTPPSIELGVNVFATQMDSESDSFGNDYDAGAFVQEPIVFDADATYTTSYIKANGSNGVLQSTAGTLTINGSGTVNAEEADDGYAMAVWANGGNVVIEGGNFEQTTDGNDATYDLIYASKGGNITIKGGTFKSVTPAWTLNVKDADRATSHITVMGGKFYQFDPSNAQTGEGEITVHEDYKVVQNGDWYEVVEKMEYTTINSLADFVDFANAVTADTSYKGYQVANNNYITVSLTTDIDLAGVTGPTANASQFAIGNGATKNNTAYCGTFDGQNHTISNYSITGNWNYYRGLFRTVGGKFTMKNVIFDTVENISGVGVATTKTRNIGVVVGAVGSGKVTFENVTIKNAHVEGAYSTGLLFGAANAGEINVINCKLENSVIETKDYIDLDDNYHNAGALFTNVDTTYGGCIGTISGNTVSNVTWNVVDSESNTGVKDVTSDLIGYQVNGVAYDINGNAK